MCSKRRRWKLRIRHILTAIAQNLQYTAGMTFEDFGSDEKTLKAVAWNLTMIGEAARLVPSEVESAYPEVPWATIRGMRNHIVHGYDVIDWEIVWTVVHDELPPLVPIFERILAEGSE
jgi:uncharacterized protein with HEPN domain